MASITVCGTAQASVTPDRATLDLGLTHVALTASAAMDEISARSQHLESELATLGFTTADWSTQGISLAEEWEWKNDTNTKVGFRATSGVTVKIVDFTRIAPLLQAAVDGADAQVRNLQWSVSESNPARRAMLGAAAIDATHRADAYAETLGLQRGAVEEVSDLPIVSTAGSSRAEPMMMRAKSADAGAAMSVNAGEIELHASVFVRFATLAR